MFTLEDLDLATELAALSATSPELSGTAGNTTADADARLHPTDYFIVGA